jgi:hypothetical protein
MRISYKSLEQLDELVRRLSKSSLMGFVRGQGEN